jgi:hypothetical protein
MSRLTQTETVKAELNKLLSLQDRTRDAEVAELYIGSRYVLVTLVRPVVIDGECFDVDSGTVDLFDLIEWHKRERSGRGAN